ncbi:MAG: hypothetical protein V3Q69_11035 [Burkholderia sp.]
MQQRRLAKVLHFRFEAARFSRLSELGNVHFPTYYAVKIPDRAAA